MSQARQGSGSMVPRSDADVRNQFRYRNESLIPISGSWLLLVSFVFLFATASCQSEDLGESISRPIQREVPEVRQVVTASVLITDEAVDAPTMETITVLPQTIVLDRGDSQQMSAQVYSPDGTMIGEAELIWSMVDPRAGVVSKDGWLVAGTSPGEFADAVSVTAIQNTPEGVRHLAGYASLTVVGDLDFPTLDTITILPPNPTLLPEQIYRMRAVGFDEDGALIPDVNFVWQVHVPELGRINELGYLTILKGTQGKYLEAVSVTGIWQGKRLNTITDISIIQAPEADDFLRVHALPQRFQLDPGDRLQLRAVALNGLGELVAGTQIRWSMVTPEAGVVDGSGLFVAGREPGIYTEAVRVEAVVPGERGFVQAEDYATLVIRREKEARPLTRLSVEPRRILIAPGGRSTLFTRALDESGQVAKNVDISWEVVDEGAGEISQLGAFVAGKTPGTYPDSIKVTATQETNGDVVSKASSVNVVITGQLTSASVSPAVAVIAPRQRLHFSLVGRDENGVELPGLVVIWSVEDDSIGSIDPFGNFLSGANPGLYENVVTAEVIHKLPHLLDTGP